MTALARHSSPARKAPKRSYVLWTPEEDAALTSHWSDASLSAEEIAAEVGRSWKACRDRATKSLGLGTRPPPASIWTDEAVAKLRELFALGHSASMIATALGIKTRNPVVSKLWRLGLHRSAIGQKESKATARRGPEHRTRSSPAEAAKDTGMRRRIARAATTGPALGIAGNAQVFEKAPDAPRKAGEAAWTPLPGSEPVRWTERAWNGCAWPVGSDGADTMSCGLKRQGVGPYCRVHWSIGHQANRPRTEAELAGDEARRLKAYARSRARAA